jgi:hypothetical protein
MLVPLWDYVEYDVYAGKAEDDSPVELLVRKLNDKLYKLQVEFNTDENDDSVEDIDADFEEYDAITEDALTKILGEFRVKPKTPIETIEVLEPVTETEI